METTPQVRKNQDGSLEIFDPRFPKSKPLRIPWDEPGFEKKQQDKIARRSLALKALGNGKHRILDTTLGLGEDALLFLTAGHTVTGIERNRSLQRLWLDALARMHENSDWRERAERFQLLAIDAIPFLQKLSAGSFDVIYIDPMFPREGKTALPKREMWTLRALTGDDLDAMELTRAALAAFDRGAVNRVVLKQPDQGGLALDRKPSGELTGKTVRFSLFAR